MHAAAPHSQWISLAISIAVVGIVLFFRIRRMGRARRLRLETLWIIPALYSVVVGVLLWKMPPQGITWLYCIIAVWVGGALGWYRGRMMQIAVDPQTHVLNQTASPAAIFFVIGLVVLRMGTRAMAAEMHAGAAALALITDILVAFAFGFLLVQRLEMFLRARRLLAAARAG